MFTEKRTRVQAYTLQMEEKMMTLGDYLKEKRIGKGINVRKMAELIGIAPAYLSDIEKGKRNSPSTEKMKKW